MDETRSPGIQVIRAAMAYVEQLSGLKTKVNNFDIKFVQDNDEDTVGMTFIITLVFLEENENG